MIVSVHQPTFLPYLGFFRKAALADIFVIYDCAQYSKNDWHNRNRILTPQGIEWITVPVSLHLKDTFLEAKVADFSFVEKHLAKIALSYKDAPYFGEIYPALEKIYATEKASLAEYNWQFIAYVFSELKLSTKIVFASTLPDIQNHHGTDALIYIAQKTGCRKYISGIDGKQYLDMEMFTTHDIEVEFNDFSPRSYPQQWTKEFVPNLSVIDALMNIGPEKTRALIT